MRNLTTFLFILTFFVCKSQDIEITSIPDWVILNDIQVESQVSKYDVLGGVYNTMIDYQVNIDEQADYNCFTTKILTQGGVNSASEIYISYDSSYQYVQFHHLFIWRNGHKINKTEELSFETLHNEQNLQSGIYSGIITAYDILKDIRLNDVIEIAYTIVGDNPIYNGKAFRLFPLEDINPVDHLFVRAVFSKNNDIEFVCKACEEIDVLVKQIGNFKSIEVERFNVKAGDFEESIPEWVIPYSHIIFSNTSSIEEVGEWAHEVFQIGEEDKLDFNEVFDEALNGDETEEEKITKLLDYVQNSIRYMGVESGIGSIKPYTPKQVVEQRFGDCKDKSLLFSNLLQGIGVKNCFPALVNTNLQHTIDQYPPSAYLFDHVIVYLKYKGEEYWLDPTIPQQGGTFKTRNSPNYDLALIVKKGSKEFVEMNNIDNYSRAEVFEELSITSFAEPGTLNVITKLYGLNADMIRSTLEYYSINEISEQFKNTYSVLFSNIMEMERLKIVDDIENNIITMIEHYQITDYWYETEGYFTSRNTVQYEPLGLYEYVSQLNCEFKSSVVRIGYPMDYSHETKIYLPSKLALSDTEIKYENSAFVFHKTSRVEEDSLLVINYHYETKTKEIEPDQFPKVCKDMNELVRELPVQLYYPKEIPSKGENKQTISWPISPSTSE